MAKKPIEKMNFDELRAEVQRMSNEMAQMKRTYEDMLYNLDASNFSGQYVKESEGYKSMIKQTAKAITTMVSNEELEKYSTTEQTAEQIKAVVSSTKEITDGLGERIEKNESAITQTATDILAEVSKVQNEVETNKASIEVNAEAIKSKVEQTYVDDEISGAVGGINTMLEEEYSTIEQTAEAIQSMVLKRFDMKNAIKVTGEIPDDAKESMVYCVQVPLVVNDEAVTDEEGNIIPASETYYYYNDVLGEWTELEGDSIYTVFEQTADGFRMRGNVVIDGSLVVGLAKVANVLYLGEVADIDNEKKIYFTGGAVITGKGQHMTISSLNTSFGGGSVWFNGDNTYFKNNVDFSEASVEWGNNRPVCVFGTDE